MSVLDHAFTFAPAAAGARSCPAITTAFAAVTAVSLLSGAFVTSELLGSPSVRVTTAVTAPTWDLEARWWPGEVRRASRHAAAMADDDLTFAKGYPQRVAARQAALAARLAATSPPAQSQFGRSAIVVPKPAPVARSEWPSDMHRVAARASDAMTERPDALDFGNRALAYGEPARRGFARPQAGLFGNLLGGGNLF